MCQTLPLPHRTENPACELCGKWNVRERTELYGAWIRDTTWSKWKVMSEIKT